MYIDVGGGLCAELHGGGILVSSETPKADTLPVLWSGTYRGVHDSTLPLHARDQDCNQLESDSSQTDSTPTPAVRRELSVDNKAVPLPLPWMPSILLHMEWPAISLQKVALVGSDQDPGVAPQPPP